jgi:hypothetical protein
MGVGMGVGMVAHVNRVGVVGEGRQWQEQQGVVVVGEVCIYNHRRCCERTTGLGGTQPSCFTLISSSGPVLTPIQT